MRRRDKSFAPQDQVLDSREPGALLLASTTEEPTAAETHGEAGENMPAVPEADPERIAFAMWNEGRVDEAIEFLQQHIVAERGRRRETALVAAGDDPESSPIQIEPASDWRERHKAALASGDFNAYGASVHTIDVTPTPADAIVEHIPRRSRRGAWLMVLGLAVLGSSAAAAYWVAGDRITDVAAIPAAQPTIPAASATSAMPEPEVATTASGVEVAAVEPDDDEIASASPDDDIDAPPPEMADLSPPAEESTSELATEAADYPAANVPGYGPTPSNASAAAVPAPEDRGENLAPAEATASVASVSEGPVPILEPRLPRNRPEQPDLPVAVAISEPGPITSDVTSPPELALQDSLPAYDPPAPAYEPTAPANMQIIGRVHRGIPGIGGATVIYNPNYPRTLTPAEYQALLERRAWARQYATERRAGAERRVITLP